MRAKLKILQLEERFILKFNSFENGDRTKPLFDRISTGWWVVLDTDPKLSVQLGETKPDLSVGQTLLLTPEPHNDQRKS